MKKKKNTKEELIDLVEQEIVERQEARIADALSCQKEDIARLLLSIPPEALPQCVGLLKALMPTTVS